jgi:hypothetical protein
MKRNLLRAALAAAGLAVCSVASAEPVTIEHYYKIRWGSANEFKELYKRNHEPILKELKKQGFITAMRKDSPFTHMAGGPRWDLRVTITFKDAETAVVTGAAFDKASDAITARLYPDKARFDAEEHRRFSLLEEHWDVIVVAE